MPTYAELTSALDQAWRAHDYGFALSCIREVLSRYRGSNSQVGPVGGLVFFPRYWNLAAAFGADDVLRAMDRVAGRISAKNDARRRSVRLEDLVEEAGSMELAALNVLAEHERVRKVKSRLNWMEKAGTVHLLGSVVHAGPTPDP